MRMRTVLAVAAAVLGVMTLTAGGAGAKGGWAVTTLDSLGGAPVAGESTPIGYTILQHGVTPVSLPDTFVIVEQADGAPLRFPGRPDGPTGHHVADVTFPESGAVAWSIEQGWFGPQDLGTITVAASGTAVGAAATGGGGGDSPLALRVGLLVATAVCAGLFGFSLRDAVRRRRPVVLPTG